MGAYSSDCYFPEYSDKEVLEAVNRRALPELQSKSRLSAKKKKDVTFTLKQTKSNYRQPGEQELVVDERNTLKGFEV
jgi:hypothetical protein